MAGFSTGSKYFARVRSSVAVALPTSGSWNTLTFDTAVFNKGETLLWDAGSPTIFTIPHQGYYQVGACVRTEPTTANKALRITTGGTSIVEHDNIGVSTPAFTQINVSTIYHFATSATLQAEVFQDSGASINAVVDGLASPVFWCAWYAIDDD